jgi:1,4-alpha-glucan branching enzyme
MWTHPGKKLLFMGGEFAQEGEWNHDSSLDWHLLAGERHRGIQALVRDLNHLYRATPSLHSRDCDPEGFRWVRVDAREESFFAYLRLGKRAAPVLVVCNFTPVVRTDLRLGVPNPGFWVERLNTDRACYGGSDLHHGEGRSSENLPWDDHPHSLVLILPPLSTIVFQWRAT